MCDLPAILKSSATFLVSPTGIGGVSISSLEEPLRGVKLKVWTVTPSPLTGAFLTLKVLPISLELPATVPANIVLCGSGTKYYAARHVSVRVFMRTESFAEEALQLKHRRLGQATAHYLCRRECKRCFSPRILVTRVVVEDFAAATSARRYFPHQCVL